MESAAIPSRPVAADERISALDILRGVAVLGILAMNIQSFAMPGAAYFFPTAYGDLNGAHYWVWYLAEIFARRKFMTVFSMLFGAGIVLMHERATAAGRGWAGLHYRRMGWLWVIGMLHAYLFWDGDILVPYAVCGLLLFLFRKVRPKRVAIVGVVFLVIGSALMLLGGLSEPSWPEESVQEFDAQWQPDQEALDHTLAEMRGGWVREVRYRAPGVIGIHTFYLPYSIFWRAAGCMLLGMALFRWGWLQGQGSTRSYVLALVAGAVIGLPLTIYTVHLQEACEWRPIPSFFLHMQYAYWGSLPLALGYTGAVMLVLRARLVPQLAARLAAVGRLALTNYLLHTLICTTLVLGHGFGLYGSVTRLGQAALVVVIWILQLIYSPLWLRRYRYGPAEWLWRSASYLKWQQWRRR